MTQAGKLYWRCCAVCSTDLATYDGYSTNIYCDKHRPVGSGSDFDQWAANLKPGDTVYLQPIVAGNLSRSRWVISARDGDRLSAHLLGAPNVTRETRVTQCANRDLTPRPQTGALY